MPSLKDPFEVTGDESNDHRAFEDYVGGVDKAQQLFRIYKDSYATTNMFPTQPSYGKTKEEVFRKKASQAGFNIRDIDALLSLQGGS
jgi:hypothetical protein